MAGKVLCIEITTHFIRAVEMDYLSKKPKVYNNFVIPTPANSYTDGTVLINDELVNCISTEISNQKISTKRVMFISLSSRIATREVLIPPIKDKKIPEFVKANAEDYFPVDVTNYEISHVLLEDVTEGGGLKHRLQVYAIPDDIVVAYRELAYNLKLKFTAFDYIGNSIYQLAKNYFNEGVQVFAKIGNIATQVLITNNGSLQLQRTIPYGVNDIYSVLVDSPTLPIVNNATDAREYFIEHDVIYDEDHDVSISVAERDRIDDTLKSLSGSISRVIDYYANNNKEFEIEGINIFGSGASLNKIDKLLTYELNRPVSCLSELDGLTIDSRKSGGIEQYLSCMGATINPVIVAENIKDSIEAEEDQLKSTSLVFKLLVAVALILIIISGSLNLYSMVKIHLLNNNLDELSEAQIVYDDYVLSSANHSEMTVIESSMYTMNKQIVAMFEDMERVLPSTVRVSAFSSEGDQITMTLVVAGKEGAAKTLIQLRNMNSLTDVKTNGITQVDDSGDVEMTVTASMAEIEK